MPAAWVTGDEVYGNSPGLRADLEARQLGYVLAVARDHRAGFGGVSHRVDALLARVPARAWQCVSAGRAPRASVTTTGRLGAWTYGVPVIRSPQATCAYSWEPISS